MQEEDVLKTIYSDNAKTYVAASKWIEKINKSKILHNLLITRYIKWKFNLGWAPWWGRQFEKMVDLVKNSFHKIVGKLQQKWKKLEEVLTVIETTLNNITLTYIEEDVQFLILTPKLLGFVQTPLIPDEDSTDIENSDLRKRQKYVQRCKEATWNRWIN